MPGTNRSPKTDDVRPGHEARAKKVDLTVFWLDLTTAYRVRRVVPTCMGSASVATDDAAAAVAAPDVLGELETMQRSITWARGRLITAPAADELLQDLNEYREEVKAHRQHGQQAKFNKPNNSQPPADGVRNDAAHDGEVQNDVAALPTVDKVPITSLTQRSATVNDAGKVTEVVPTDKPNEEEGVVTAKERRNTCS
ncbi:hypothetical protein QQF64_033906 [Cirrhinus molitorella]|uniref:Uncharacterized protein n=1 Tax=Cirrhinus molitorella TaxID=172907 RepID=A0ABR3MV84_9TELE